MHGGDWASYQQVYGKLPLDFSANVSPLGVPESVKRAVADAAEKADRYPDPLCRELREEIARKENVEAEYILCGNGAADLIWRLAAVCRSGKALIPVPAFSEYRAALTSCGCAVQTYLLKEKDGFHLTEEFLDRLPEFFAGLSGMREAQCAEPTSRGLSPAVRGSVWLCEPGNPSGVTTNPALLRKILDCCAEAGVLLVADECFLDFTEDPEGHTLKGLLRRYPNLIILRACTKTYAMAGIRLGYGMCADEKLRKRMQNSGQPWSVSHIAQVAGMAAMRDDLYREKSRRLIRTERYFLQSGLLKLGFRVIPGEANYLLFHSAVPLGEKLRERGILIRDCRDFEGWEESSSQSGWYRTSIRKREENRRLLSALKEIVNGFTNDCDSHGSIV